MSKNPVAYACCGAAGILTVVQTNEIFQLVSLILTCIATLVALAFTIYKWVKNATADGKIDKEEVEELVDIIENTADDLKDKTKDKK